jgi:hypothetical protein
MTRPLLLSLSCLTIAVLPLTAQQPDTTWRRQVPAVVTYGKWVTLAATVGMGIKAAQAHREADRSFDRLSAYCLGDDTRCQTGPGGRYLDPVSERYFQASVRSDRRARHWLFAGEGTLLATAGLFVWELTRPSRPPRNIPFEPTVSVVGPRTMVGVSVAF